MEWFDPAELPAAARPLLERLRRERIVWDTGRAGDLETLRSDVDRVAADMEAPDRPPPMFWSGIPWPEPGEDPSCDYQLVVSVGGTKTDFALLRLQGGRVVGLDPASGREVIDPGEIERVKAAVQMATPKHPATPSGLRMVAEIADHFARRLRPHRAALDRCEAVLLSWGFAHRVVRTGPRLAGGLSAVVTKMTKDQAPFTADLKGRDIGRLFGSELRRVLGWSRPVAVANDTVMALHYFLDPRRRRGHARVGLFINGTGTNFAAAEPYAVRAGGIVSAPGEEYAPERLTASRPLAPGERAERFFVNYESGSIDLAATRTRFDTDPEYPIERNVLAGGNAFAQSLRALACELLPAAAYERVREAWAAAGHPPESPPDARVVSALAAEDGAPQFRALEELPADLRAGLELVARAIVARSALHAALVLAAITRRTGFGRGAGGLPDLLGMEGSVWRIPRYQELVKRYWRDLAGGVPLDVHLEAEPHYNASLAGPLYLAAIHR